MSYPSAVAEQRACQRDRDRHLRPVRLGGLMSNWMKATAAAEGITHEQAELNFVHTMRPTSLLQRFTTTEEVANMVVSLCSEQASGTTGSAMRVDGGVLRQIA